MVTIETILAQSLGGIEPCDETALLLAGANDLDTLMGVATQVRDIGFGGLMTYSPKVFIPLTRLCRDSCHYCTFATRPSQLERAYMSPEEVLAVAKAGQRLGCHEALFTLGERPEERWQEARDELTALGFSSTIEYLKHVASLVLAETSLLPHLNPGTLDSAEIAMLRPVSASMGLMLETASQRLSDKRGPHFGSPDKVPAARLATIAATGEAGVPLTTGILVGIGETRLERIESLLAIRSLHRRFGHIQEVIIQNFLPKPGTRMAGHSRAARIEHLWTVAVARIVFGSHMSIQAPPNLAPEYWEDLISAGINDWGGISSVTSDFVNPEAPWPNIEDLARVCLRRRKELMPRLTVYPRYIKDAARWVAPQVQPKVLRVSDSEGFARDSNWLAGKSSPALASSRRSEESTQAEVNRVLSLANEEVLLSESQIATLFSARGGSYSAVCETADRFRKASRGDIVSYVVNRNINYTNICSYHCTFCAFSKGKTHEDLRGKPYLMDLGQFRERVSEAWRRGATEVCLQGGIHPDYDGNTYLDFLRAAKQAAPAIHVHAFSPLEVWQGAHTLGWSVKDFLSALQDEGLGSLPGTAAEILDDEVRATLCPDKIRTNEWFEVMSAAHELGLKTTSTIMFGHIERPIHWARHLVRLRDHQRKFGGFTEFVPLPFVAEEAPIFRKGRSRRGPTLREAVLMHAVSRIALHRWIPNIQTSWVKMGTDGVQLALQAGANDLGGTLMNESITRAAGATHGQEKAPATLEALVTSIGRTPRQRTTLYGTVPQERVRASFNAPPLAEISLRLVDLRV